MNTNKMLTMTWDPFCLIKTGFQPWSSSGKHPSSSRFPSKFQAAGNHFHVKYLCSLVKLGKLQRWKCLPTWFAQRSRIAPRIEQEDRSSKDESPPAAGAGLTRHPAPSKGERTASPLVWLSLCFKNTPDLGDVCKQWSNLLLSICYWDWNHLTL